MQELGAMKIKSKALGRYLKERRLELKATRNTISKKLGYPNAQSIYNWEKGLAIPPTVIWRKLIKAYKITPDEWLSIMISEIEDQIRRYV